MQYKDILLTVDYDRTFTAPDSSIPARNMEAIRFFMEQGGGFTVNTGRGPNLSRKIMQNVPMNAPILLFNGSTAYENGRCVYYHAIDLPMWETVMAVAEAFPELNVEIQGLEDHYLIDPEPGFIALYDSMQWNYSLAEPGKDIGPFIKFAIYGQTHDSKLSSMYDITPQEEARFRELADFIMDRWGDKVDICLAAPRILDVQAKGISKGRAARELQQRLGKQLLICVGDADNDIPMLDAADFAFCPSDGVLADRYPNVCPCAEGAVAEVIFEKIPEILHIQP